MSELEPVEAQSQNSSDEGSVFDFSESESDKSLPPYKLYPDAEVIDLDASPISEIVDLATSSEDDEKHKFEHFVKKCIASGMTLTSSCGGLWADKKKRRKRKRKRTRKSSRRKKRPGSQRESFPWHTESRMKLMFKYDSEKNEVVTNRFPTRFSPLVESSRTVHSRYTLQGSYTPTIPFKEPLMRERFTDRDVPFPCEGRTLPASKTNFGNTPQQLGTRTNPVVLDESESTNSRTKYYLPVDTAKHPNLHHSFTKSNQTLSPERRWVQHQPETSNFVPLKVRIENPAGGILRNHPYTHPWHSKPGFRKRGWAYQRRHVGPHAPGAHFPGLPQKTKAAPFTSFFLPKTYKF